MNTAGCTILATTAPSLAADTARAGDFAFSHHEAGGSGGSNVFDGGPVEFAEGSTYGADDDRMTFSASDTTQDGSMGASARASGRSEISPCGDDGMRIEVKLDVEYAPAFFPGGDDPGAAAEGSLVSIIEFVMPVDQLTAGYLFEIDDTIESEGSATVLMENVTRSQAILDRTYEVFPPVETTLSAGAGDLIRITSEMSGSGETLVLRHNSNGGFVRSGKRGTFYFNLAKVECPPFLARVFPPSGKARRHPLTAHASRMAAASQPIAATPRAAHNAPGAPKFPPPRREAGVSTGQSRR